MNTNYALLIAGQAVYWTNNLDQMRQEIMSRQLQDGEYTIQEHGSWGAQ
jgi:hypothetical protein